MTTTPPTPVEPGQVWRDNDQRSRGAGEFVVWAVVRRGKVERLEEPPPAAWPRAERRLEFGRDYELIGKSR